MANHKSAVKQHRRSLKLRALNRHNRSRLRSTVKKLREALDSGDSASAKGLLTPTLAIVDRAAKLGAIHPRTAARTKSRLARALNRLQAAGS